MSARKLCAKGAAIRALRLWLVVSVTEHAEALRMPPSHLHGFEFGDSPYSGCFVDHAVAVHEVVAKRPLRKALEVRAYKRFSEGMQL